MQSSLTPTLILLAAWKMENNINSAFGLKLQSPNIGYHAIAFNLVILRSIEVTMLEFVEHKDTYAVTGLELATFCYSSRKYNAHFLFRLETLQNHLSDRFKF